MRTRFLTLLLALPAFGAWAGDDELQACRPYMNLCKNVEPGEGRQMRCMYEKRAQLSPQCAALITDKYERYIELTVIKAQKDKVK